MGRLLPSLLAIVWLVGCGGATDVPLDDSNPDPEGGSAGAPVAGASIVAGASTVAGRGAYGGAPGSAGASIGGYGNSPNSAGKTGFGGTTNVAGSTNGGSGVWAGGTGGTVTNGGAGNAAGWNGAGTANWAGAGGTSGASAGSAGSGGAGYDPACPPVALIRTRDAAAPAMCTEGTSCDYDPFTYCLCSSQSSIFCQKVDPTCPNGEPLPGSAEFAAPAPGAAPPANPALPAPVPPLWHCECSMGRWLCG